MVMVLTRRIPPKLWAELAALAAMVEAARVPAEMLAQAATVAMPALPRTRT
jgi:hypothetical protein